MKTIRLFHGTDVLDARDLPTFRDKADATDKLPDGRAVPRFVFHALHANSTAIDPALRGRPVQVTDEQALELLTFPLLRFEEVSPEQAAADQYRATLARDGFGRLLDPRTGAVIPDPVPGTPLPAAPPVAPSLPRAAEDVRAEVARELRAAGADAHDDAASETPAEAGGRKKPKE